MRSGVLSESAAAERVISSFISTAGLRHCPVMRARATWMPSPVGAKWLNCGWLIRLTDGMISPTRARGSARGVFAWALFSTTASMNASLSSDIASEAKQSPAEPNGGDCFVAHASRACPTCAYLMPISGRPEIGAPRNDNRRVVETTLSARDASLPNRLAMYNGNQLKIGLFGANCSSGRSATTVPERWSASWTDCLRLVRMAEAAGIDFMLPIARWKGYGGATDFHGTSLETMTWAAGLLAATERITVFGTVHAPLFNPLIAAKEFVTADHIGQGRFGLNLVVGWNEGEFEMFGVSQREHEVRYAFAQEWLDAVMRAWTEEVDFVFAGEFLTPRGCAPIRSRSAARGRSS